jgi:hypothetical protein
MDVRQRRRANEEESEAVREKRNSQREHKVTNAFMLMRLGIYLLVFVVVPVYFVTTSPVISVNFSRPFNAKYVK